MKKYIFRFAVTLITFGIGVISLNSWFLNLCSYKPLGENKKIKTSTEVKKSEVNPEDNQELTFSQSGVIACGWDSFKNAASFTSYQSSDGTIVNSTIIYGLKSEKAALKRFKYELKNADKIIELSPALDYWKNEIGKKAILEFDGSFLIVKYYKGSSEYQRDFSVLISSSSSLQHVTLFEQQEESLARSNFINKLK